jgi:hypothetical protein
MSELKEMKNYRIEAGITRGKEIEITVDGNAIRAFEGETIGAALTAADIREIRRAPQHWLSPARRSSCRTALAVWI